MPSIKIDNEVYRKLLMLKAKLIEKQGRNVTFNDALRLLIENYEENIGGL